MRALTFLAALCTLVAAGCGGGSEGEAAASAPPSVTETAGPEAMRPTAPPIEGTTLDGEKAVLADLRGKHVFVNVWSSW